jgi:thioredoxin 1
MGVFHMLSRRSMLLAVIATSTLGSATSRTRTALAGDRAGRDPLPFDAGAFADAQKAGKPILVAIHASWCPICKAQKPILSELLVQPKFADLTYFVIDFDSQKDLVQRFGAQKQSTLIAFKGSTEEQRSVGDSNPASIAALVNKAL